MRSLHKPSSFHIFACIVLLGTGALTSAQSAPASFPYFLSGKYDSQSKKWSAWLLDQGGNAIYNSSGADGEPLTKIDFKWIDDSLDSTPQNLSFTYNNVKLLSDGLGLPVTFHDALNLFKGFSKSYSVSYGLRKSWKPDCKKLSLRFDGGLEANFTRDEAGQVLNTGQLALEMKFSTIPNAVNNKSNLYLNLMRANGRGWTAAQYREQYKQLLQLNSDATLTANAKQNPGNDAVSDLMRVHALIHPEAPPQAFAAAFIKNGGDSSPYERVAEAITNTDGISNLIQAMHSKQQANNAVAEFVANPANRHLIRAIDFLGDPLKASKEFADSSSRIEADTHMPFDSSTFTLNKVGAEDSEPPIVFFLQGITWAKEDRKVKGFVEATITWKFGKANEGGTVRPGLLMSYLIGESQTGEDHKKGLFSVGLVVPLH